MIAEARIKAADLFLPFDPRDGRNYLRFRVIFAKLSINNPSREGTPQ